jgi:hypothetical protein
MTESHEIKKIRRLIVIMILIVLIILGFTPWENWLPIQIMDSTLTLLTSGSTGLVGLFGLTCCIIAYLKINSRKSSGLIIALLFCLLIPIGLLFVLNLSTPTFGWKDESVYSNGNDYLVIQEFEGFVTSNLSNTRLIRTKSPFSMIRVVEEDYKLNDNDSRFNKNVVIYEGKIWQKEPVN